MHNNLPVFQNISSKGRCLLDQGLIHKAFPPATELLYRGAQISGAYIVTKGRLRVFSISPSGAEATLYCIDPGETCVLALNCLFNDLLYPAWVATETETSVAILPGPTFRQLFESEPSIQNLTVHALSSLVFRLMGELEQVHFCTLEQRLANLLLLRASADGILRMTQQELAYHLGTTREVIARLMGDLVLKGLVKTRRKEITIVNAKELAALITELTADC
ncbi:Crp/Fnr family transcriptional regulator [Trichlorobacter lovleyi]|uniref:Crp/Fnr family transcriptional regulator n=1 Tax=Trichlorobacter lovleyi TaxID=313985 RepID=UPI00223FF649|nr:Crp/Fnr family transcriptional regulator [Trichlorobacter lovleyi]